MFRRIANLFRGFLNLFIGGIERQNPEALLAAEKAGSAVLKIKRPPAELTEMPSGMISEIGGSGDTLNRLHGMVEEEREKASGRARVARDSLHAADIDMQEHEQKALADQALA